MRSQSNYFIGEFDPGSGRTLAACLIHASRADRWELAPYKAPLTETEQLLADIWQEVLGIDRIGITDNFFALGGDSIKGIQMASRLQQHGWKLEMKDLFP
ncbi:phosphopantetheine-binding protein [Bacillus paralicheniformis]|nr:phosphopantetheine-binding protein [Bacillus paralicheniformis]